MAEQSTIRDVPVKVVTTDEGTRAIEFHDPPAGVDWDAIRDELVDVVNRSWLATVGHIRVENNSGVVDVTIGESFVKTGEVVDVEAIQEAAGVGDR